MLIKIKTKEVHFVLKPSSINQQTFSGVWSSYLPTFQQKKYTHQKIVTLSYVDIRIISNFFPLSNLFKFIFWRLSDLWKIIARGITIHKKHQSRSPFQRHRIMKLTPDAIHHFSSSSKASDRKGKTKERWTNKGSQRLQGLGEGEREACSPEWELTASSCPPWAIQKKRNHWTTHQYSCGYGATIHLPWLNGRWRGKLVQRSVRLYSLKGRCFIGKNDSCHIIITHCFLYNTGVAPRFLSMWCIANINNS